MTETTRDLDTGLPLLGTPSEKSVPIDPALLPDLRAKHEARETANAQVGVYAPQLVKVIAAAANVGTGALVADQEYGFFTANLLRSHNVTPDQFLSFDFDRGLILTK